MNTSNSNSAERNKMSRDHTSDNNKGNIHLFIASLSKETAASNNVNTAIDKTSINNQQQRPSSSANNSTAILAVMMIDLQMHSSNKLACTSNTSTSVEEPNFGSATFKDVNVDEQGQPIGMFGILWEDITQKALRPLGKSFDIWGYSNLRKQVFINAICAAYINRDLQGSRNNMPTRKQRQRLTGWSTSSSLMNLQETCLVVLVTLELRQSFTQVIHATIVDFGLESRLVSKCLTLFMIRYSFHKISTLPRS